jgi:hypothetical protein
LQTVLLGTILPRRRTETSGSGDRSRDT